MYNAQLFGLAMIIYLISSCFFLINLINRNNKVAHIAIWSASVGFIIHTLALVLRTVASYRIGIGQPPFTNLYSSMVFFSWSVVLIFFMFEKKYSYRSLGVFIMPIAFLILAATGLMSSEIEPLVPALQSNWLLIHVVTCFFGYAAFAVAFGISIMYLWKYYYETEGLKDMSLGKYISTYAAFFSIIGGIMSLFVIKSFLVFLGSALIAGIIGAVIGQIDYNIKWFLEKVVGKVIEKIAPLLPDAQVLDDLEYKAVAIGFPFLTLGIITGAAWAHYAWGSYWSWDPKETWSLITWFVYAAFLHARFSAGWKGRRTAILCILGFLFVLMTYFGVSFFLPGLHSYA